MQNALKDYNTTTATANSTHRSVGTFTPQVIVTALIYIVGGYQWYFYNKPHFNLGLRFNGRLGYSYWSHDAKVENYHSWSYPDTGNNIIQNSIATSHGTIHTLNYSTDAQFLWDFLDRDKHSFGVHFSPIGFDGYTQFTNSSGTDYWFESYTYRDMPQLNRILTTNTKTKSSSIMHIFYYTINFGIHYYYNIHHQIFVTYRHSWSLFSAYNGNIVAETSRYGGGRAYFSYAYKF